MGTDTFHYQLKYDNDKNISPNLNYIFGKRYLWPRDVFFSFDQSHRSASIMKERRSESHLRHPPPSVGELAEVSSPHKNNLVSH